MRRCKYFNRSTWVYKSFPEGTMEYGSSVQCLKCKLVTVLDGCRGVLCNEGVYPCYTPVELDPYWKDIVDETNRRLYGR